MNERPFLTVDCVVFHDNAVVLIRRAHEPFRGWYALPGGFVEVGETVEDACRRETREETGLVVEDLRLIGVYSDPARDPRRHTVSVAFLGRADLASLKAGDDAGSAELVADWRHAEMAFDHKKILSDAWRLHQDDQRGNAGAP
jgi:8-oxo-dGTP diphosphatase